MRCTLNGVSLYYEVVGEGTPIVMLHGFYPDHRLMKGCMEPIVKNYQGWRRIYLDLPGMGQTPTDPSIDSSDKMLDLVVNFLDAIIPNERFLVAGESYGGYLARGIIKKRPLMVQGLLLICPVIEPQREKRTVPPHQVLERDPELIASLSAEEAVEFESMSVVQSEKIYERYRDEIWAGVKLAEANYLETLREKAYSFEFDPDSLDKPFEGPTLMLMGRQDASVGYRDAWRIIDNFPRGTFIIMDKAGHNLQLEQESLFEQLVIEWLQRVRKENA
ncbi:2-hydroxy-6-oxo-6-(2'-aminophenyl)hexa-2,4-dienoic acid hydrolase [Peptococcaceae bacterium CEB3]|nr:2-hydroxy-6-oxo-6-(2'-aminophenyl)hexa-2,4-dienoic acid hydrolase [Peptococcaceae bacterium CEB3]